jgi:pimeloyl-ACP methyl ester carboxylesterase
MLDTLLHKYLRIPYALHVHVVRKPRQARATVLFLHGIGTSGAAWDDVVKGLPKDVAVIAVDLLGFGKSPSPEWAKYSAATQARSLIATLLKLNIRQRLIIVGHSMGALVAVETAKRYPVIVKSLILCSPPFYEDIEKRFLPNRDRTLKSVYKLAKNHPEQFAAVAALTVKYKLVEKTVNVTAENVTAYMAALESSIINQTSLHDAQHLHKAMHILHGALDPVVIKKNLDAIVKANPRAELTVVYLAGHSLVGPYITALTKKIKEIVPPHNKK